MRITQGMMKRPSVLTQLNKTSIFNKKATKKQTVLQKLMAQKKKVLNELKNVDKKKLSGTEKSKLVKTLKDQLKKIDEQIKTENDKKLKKKKPIDKKKELQKSKLRVAQMRSEAFNIMLSGNNSKPNRMSKVLANNSVKNMNQLIALRKLNALKKKTG